MIQANLKRCYYRSVGPQLSIDALVVDFEVDGEIYSHTLQNTGWSYQTQALSFMAYVGVKPTDFDRGEIDLSGKQVPVASAGEEEGYGIQNKALMAGSQMLQEADWFNPNGQVWNSSGAQNPGMIINPDGGNKAGVPADGEE